jgi:hypothetical protein
MEKRNLQHLAFQRRPDPTRVLPTLQEVGYPGHSLDARHGMALARALEDADTTRFEVPRGQ